MNYMTFCKKLTTPDNVQIYDSSVSEFVLEGKVAMRRCYDRMGCDNGMYFYCSYKDEMNDKVVNLLLLTPDLVITQLPSIAQATIQNGKKMQDYFLKPDGAVVYVDGSQTPVPMKIVLIGDNPATPTIDLEIEVSTNRTVVIELTRQTLNNQINKLSPTQQ